MLRECPWPRTHDVHLERLFELVSTYLLPPARAGTISGDLLGEAKGQGPYRRERPDRGVVRTAGYRSGGAAEAPERRRRPDPDLMQEACDAVESRLRHPGRASPRRTWPVQRWTRPVGGSRSASVMHRGRPAGPRRSQRPVRGGRVSTDGATCRAPCQSAGAGGPRAREADPRRRGVAGRGRRRTGRARTASRSAPSTARPVDPGPDGCRCAGELSAFGGDRRSSAVEPDRPVGVAVRDRFRVSLGDALTAEMPEDRRPVDPVPRGHLLQGDPLLVGSYQLRDLVWLKPAMDRELGAERVGQAHGRFGRTVSKRGPGRWKVQRYAVYLGKRWSRPVPPEDHRLRDHL